MASEEMSFERWTTTTDGRRMPAYTISSPMSLQLTNNLHILIKRQKNELLKIISKAFNLPVGNENSKACKFHVDVTRANYKLSRSLIWKCVKNINLQKLIYGDMTFFVSYPISTCDTHRGIIWGMIRKMSYHNLLIIYFLLLLFCLPICLILPSWLTNGLQLSYKYW